MRLISTDPHLRVGHFNLPSEVDVGYAILSHVWRHSGEQPYAEVHRLAHEGAKVSDPRLSTKVRECHRLARANGLRWFWVDAPCIDQTNSAELSEAISSMYEWYAQASICFAHLPDVPPDDIIRAPGSAFRRSIYFRRAWTLQELIAPRRVLFLSADWTVLGDKQELADLLEEITGIDQDVLTFHRPLSEVSVAVRLSWASHRDASRLEDKAYCLMGLFDIHMTACYGEGAHKAFGRLQVKILERVCDHTLLAWAGSRDPRNPSIWPFAPSPEAFTREFRLVAVDMRRFVESIRHLCSVSYPGQPLVPSIGPVDHHGLRCRLPVLCYGSTPLAALLACREEHSPSTYIVLALHSNPSLLREVYNVAARPRLVPINMDLIARNMTTQSSALNMRFMSFHIAVLAPLSLAPSLSHALSLSSHLPPRPDTDADAASRSDAPRFKGTLPPPRHSHPRLHVVQLVLRTIRLIFHAIQRNRRRAVQLIY
ncbi:HET-domain-containing protein, partial [Trametes versicolor FP-101664 SS1]|uniref:HET-domain-containing protein n=1 Tax=Trametes versicolor (strain FP-101664) TaxID=717944 RepID=UPI0004623096